MPTQINDPGLPGGYRPGNSERLPRSSRLIKHEVVTLLRQGARFSRAELEIKLGENKFGRGRIAIAVPKRILKLAVDRNQVKRLIREVFRRNRVRVSPVDLLVTLRGVPTIGPGERSISKQQRRQLRGTFSQLLADISRRLSTVPQ